MTEHEVKARLCLYDRRNPNSDLVEEPTNDPCYCDNCYYGRTKLAEELLWLLKMYKELQEQNTRLLRTLSSQ